MAGQAPTTRRIVETLGGRKAFLARIRTSEDLRRSVRRGLRYDSFEALSRKYGIAVEDMVFILAVPARTLARRKKEKRLRPEESDRLVRLGRIAALAEETLRDREKATKWLHKPNRALGNDVPLRRLDTDLGAREVEDTLLRIAHGVYS